MRAALDAIEGKQRRGREGARRSGDHKSRRKARGQPPSEEAYWRTFKWRTTKRCTIKWRTIKWRTIKWRTIKWRTITWRTITWRTIKECSIKMADH